MVVLCTIVCTSYVYCVLFCFFFDFFAYIFGRSDKKPSLKVALRLGKNDNN